MKSIFQRVSKFSPVPGIVAGILRFGQQFWTLTVAFTKCLGWLVYTLAHAVVAVPYFAFKLARVGAFYSWAIVWDAKINYDLGRSREPQRDELGFMNPEKFREA